MAYKNRMDLHTHTDNSFDGHHSIMYMCEKACEKGIKAIAFTDHIEVDCYYEEHYDKVTVQAYFEMAKARSAFDGKIIVCAGMEMGEASYNPEVAEKILNDHKYDIILGSIHNLRGEDDFCFLDYFNNDVDEILNEYFDEICGLADWGKFDSLAHLTYPLRYIEGEAGIHVDLSKYSSKIDEALRTLAEKDRALEINTSGLFNKIGKTLPDENIVRRFRELGGKLVTVGSDSHYADYIGRGIETGMDIAKRSGFDSIALFSGREPIEIPIE